MDVRSWRDFRHIDLSFDDSPQTALLYFMGHNGPRRVCIVNFRTSLADVEALLPLVVRMGNELDSTLRPGTLGFSIKLNDEARILIADFRLMRSWSASRE
jgi:hypothetical protein